MRLKKYKNILFTVIFIILTIFIIIWTVNEEYEEPKEEINKEEKKEIKNEIKEKKEKENTKVIIDIKGEIVNPGVYELTDKNNVNDAINMAGGLTKNSDTSNINLSKKLKDEMVIIVYSKKEIENMEKSNENTCEPCNNACITSEDENSKLTNKESKSIINLNTATKEELLTLDGIGESKANAIIDYRNKNGPFKNVEEIKNVSGIGESAYEKLKDNIEV